MIEALQKVIKRLHYPLEVMLSCVRWYVADPLSLRHIEEMMAERGVLVDHATVHRWALKILPALTGAFEGESASWAGVGAWTKRTSRSADAGGISIGRSIGMVTRLISY